MFFKKKESVDYTEELKSSVNELSRLLYSKNKLQREKEDQKAFEEHMKRIRTRKLLIYEYEFLDYNNDLDREIFISDIKPMLLNYDRYLCKYVLDDLVYVLNIQGNEFKYEFIVDGITLGFSLYKLSETEVLYYSSLYNLKTYELLEPDYQDICDDVLNTYINIFYWNVIND